MAQREKSKPRKSNTVAGGLADAWIDLAFSVRARDIEKADAKTKKDQAIQKRTEPAFIEPMQCKSVTALPAGEKWSFEIKFDGYRCIAVKRWKGGHAILAPQEGAQ